MACALTYLSRYAPGVFDAAFDFIRPEPADSILDARWRAMFFGAILTADSTSGDEP